jgi:DASH complex subunit ASK1
MIASINEMLENDEASTSTSTFSSSGEDSVHDTAHPSAAFLLASRQRGRHDYDDHDDDDDDDEPDGDDDDDDEPDGDDDFDGSLDAAALAPVHPFARARALSAQGDAAEYDDSFDSLDGGDRDEGEQMPEETVFGVRPAEREAALPQLRMLGEDWLQDTIGIGTQLARVGRIEESPTPWGGGGGGRGG